MSTRSVWRASLGLSLALTATLNTTIAQSQGARTPPPTAPERLDDTARVRGWRSDFELLEREAKRLHASPRRPADSPTFASAVRSLIARVPTTPDRGLVVEVQRLMAMLGDGHSLLYPAPAPRASFNLLPIDVYLFADGLYVVGGTGLGAELIGQRITRIGTRPTPQVVRALEPYISRDNAIGVSSFASLYLVLPPFLEAIGVADDSATVTLTVEDARRRPRVVTLRADAPRRIRRTLAVPPNETDPAPLWLQHQDRNIWMTELGGPHALYVQFNQVADGPTATLGAFSTQLRERLSANRTRHLVIDVRHNPGGNNQLLEPLLTTITDWAKADSSRVVYALTSRSTFSAAQNFINRLERRVPRTVFAGEPSMSSPNFTGEDFPVRLPFSGLVVSISNRYWQDSARDDVRPFIAPHLDIRMRGPQWLANRDPVLEAVTARIGNR